MKLKPFNGYTMQAWACLSALKCYFIAVGISYIATKAADTEVACQYIVILIEGYTTRWIDRLEVQSNPPNSFLEFEKLFINCYAPLDNKNIAKDNITAAAYYMSCSNMS